MNVENLSYEKTLELINDYNSQIHHMYEFGRLNIPSNFIRMRKLSEIVGSLYVHLDKLKN